MGVSLGRPWRRQRGQRSFALSTYLATQQAEAAQVLSDTLFQTTAARRERAICAIYDAFATQLPGCVLKGGAAFSLHLAFMKGHLQADDARRLDSLALGLDLFRISDVDIAWSPAVLVDPRGQLVRALHDVASCIGHGLLSDHWPELKARLCAATSLRASPQCSNTSYHDGDMHLADALRKPLSAPVAASHHAALADNQGNLLALGRLNICLVNARHGATVKVPFCDVTVPVEATAVKAETTSVMHLGGTTVMLRPFVALWDDLLRMVFEETMYRPWQTHRFGKVRRHLLRAFLAAFVLDGLRLRLDFSRCLDAWLDFESQEARRGDGAHRRLAYLGLTRPNALDLADAAAQWWHGGGHLAQLMLDVTQACHHAPDAAVEKDYPTYRRFLSTVSIALVSLEDVRM